MDNVPPGQTLGPYRILHQIGQGGMATVYKAYHAAMDRYVAIKVLPRQLAENPEFTGRFQQEARIIANLEHPHILPVHDYGESDGISYLVMRYLEAGTLKDRMRASPLSPKEIDSLFTQLAEALDYAHSRGVIHRDLKPSNALVNARGDLFLTDFGIAKLLESSSEFTGTGAMMGTPAYMSPEQAQGLRVDQRTDIYALGIILFEMVTGRVPYEAETPLAVTLKQINEPLPLPSTFKPDVAPSIERLLLKALSKNPDDRYANAPDFLAAWKQALAESETMRAAPVAPPAAAPGPVPAAPPAPAPAPRPAAAPARPSSPLAWILGGAGLLLLVMLVLAALVIPRILSGFARTEQQATPAAPTEVAQATPGPESTAPENTPPPEATPFSGAIIETAAPPTGESAWTSWPPSNVIFDAEVVGDQVISWGLGGVLVWNSADGSLVRQFTPLDGLPHPQVNTVLVDEEEQAFWIGTEDGLALFDDGKWTYYNTDDGLDSSTIGALTWGPDSLIVGTNYSWMEEGGGLFRFDGSSWDLVPGFPSGDYGAQPDLLSANVNTLLLDESAVALWVGTHHGLGRYDGESWTRYFVEHGLPHDSIWALMVDWDGVLWVGTADGAARFNGDSFEVVEQLQGRGGVYGIVQDAEGSYWFSGDGGLARFDPARSDWEFFSPDTGDLPVYTTLRAAASPDGGTLFFGSYGGGLIRYDDAFSNWSVPNTPQIEGFASVLPAPDGTLWFVEEYGSLTEQFDPASGQWSLVPLPCDYCSPLTFDPSGNLWMGGDLGLWIMPADGSPPAHLTTEHGLPADGVRAMDFDSAGFAWLGTDAGVAVFDGQSIVEVFNAENTGLASDEVRTILQDSYGTMWVGTARGLSRFTPDAGWEHFTGGSPFREDLDYILDLVDVDGALWVAAGNDAAWRYANGAWENFPSNAYGTVAAGADGSLWFGTYYGGVLRFDGSEWTNYYVDDGLVHPNVTSIYVDPSGAVWFATSGGVSRFIP